MKYIAFFVTAISLLCAGCASVQPISGASVTEVLTSDTSFHLTIPPIASVDIPAGSQIPVVGTTTRDGKMYRVVRLPDPTAQFLLFLVTDQGKFEGSAINTSGARMGWSYHPSPDITLTSESRRVPDQQAIADQQYGTEIPADDAQKQAASFLEKNLKDPYSAHISYSENVAKHCFKDGLILGGKNHCGYLLRADVNARNSYGGYTGSVPYAFFFQNGRLRLVAERAGMVGETVLWRDL